MNHDHWKYVKKKVNSEAHANLLRKIPEVKQPVGPGEEGEGHCSIQHTASLSMYLLLLLIFFTVWVKLGLHCPRCTEDSLPEPARCSDESKKDSEAEHQVKEHKVKFGREDLFVEVREINHHTADHEEGTDCANKEKESSEDWIAHHPKLTFELRREANILGLQPLVQVRDLLGYVVVLWNHVLLAFIEGLPFPRHLAPIADEMFSLMLFVGHVIALIAFLKFTLVAIARSCKLLLILGL